MVVVFVSNFLTHHQKPFCERMRAVPKNQFYFISTVPMEAERANMGWTLADRPVYEIKTYESEDASRCARKLVAECDIAVMGACDQTWIRHRLKQESKGITFLYNERIFKKGDWQVFSPGALKFRLDYFQNKFRKKVYMLCASAYLSTDLKRMGTYWNRCYKWGYFPSLTHYADIDSAIHAKEKASILWTGRFLDWKHPEDAVRLAHGLVQKGYSFSLDMIGDGERKSTIEKMIREYSLEEYVHLHGFMRPEEVRGYMEKADIYLFTSDRHEGWGAVLNESMNSACAVVANRKIGSVPYLLKHEENGLIYDRRKQKDLLEKVSFLLDHPEIKEKYQRRAYDTLVTMWNAEKAAERLLGLSENLLAGKDTEYTDGPCSKA